MTIVLPIPPALNNMYVNINGRGRARSAEYNAWMKEADGCLMQQKKARPKVNASADWYHARLLFPATMKGDVDGRGKAVLDFLVKRAITPDDARCWAVLLSRSFDVEEHFCHVLVEDFNPAEAA